MRYLVMLCMLVLASCINTSSWPPSTTELTMEIVIIEEDTEEESPPVVTPTPSVMLYWSAPTERINGEPMSSEEIGGYAIRYRTMASRYITMIVSSRVTQWYIEVVEPDSYTFEVAVFDTDDVYSDYVIAQEH